MQSQTTNGSRRAVWGALAMLASFIVPRARRGRCSSEPRKARRQNRRRRNSSCRAAGHALRGHGVAELPRSHRHRDRVRGHTGPELRMGQRNTRQQCEDMLYGDLLKHAQALDCIKHPLTDGQRPRS